MLKARPLNNEATSPYLIAHFEFDLHEDSYHLEPPNTPRLSSILAKSDHILTLANISYTS